jgi:hypothetical protein
MCGFGGTTGLGKTHFNFSCKNYSSKVYTSFAEVVGFGTISTEKWFCNFWMSLRFSMIFASFS